MKLPCAGSSFSSPDPTGNHRLSSLVCEVNVMIDTSYKTRNFHTSEVQTLIQELKILSAAEYLANLKVMLISRLNTVSNVSILAFKQDNGRRRDRGRKMGSSPSVFLTPINDQFPLYFLYELLRISFLFNQKIYSQHLSKTETIMFVFNMFLP